MSENKLFVIKYIDDKCDTFVTPAMSKACADKLIESGKFEDCFPFLIEVRTKK